MKKIQVNILFILEIAKKARKETFVITDYIKIKDFVKKKKDTMNKIKGQMTA